MKKRLKPASMAGEQNTYLRFRIPVALKGRYKRVCVALGVDMSKELRHLMEGFCDAAERGEALIAPLEVHSAAAKKKDRKKQ